jgi:micrococcal nuclease
VNYPTGPSTARGLEPAKAPKAGTITWTWTVASNTPKGTWPVMVSCTIGDRYGEAKTSLAVK